jgi:hypothetical protein
MEKERDEENVCVEHCNVDKWICERERGCYNNHYNKNNNQ